MQLQTTPQRNFSQNKNLGIKGGTVGKRKSIQISASSKNVDILLVNASKMLDFLAPPPSLTLLLAYHTRFAGSPRINVLRALRKNWCSASFLSCNNGISPSVFNQQQQQYTLQL